MNHFSTFIGEKAAPQMLLNSATVVMLTTQTDTIIQGWWPLQNTASSEKQKSNHSFPEAIAEGIAEDHKPACSVLQTQKPLAAR